MPEMSLSEAAAWAGKGRPAILKAIQKGTLSARKDDDGQWRIEPSELQRVYRPAPRGNADDVSRSEQEIAVARDREMALMREMLDTARREVAKVERERDDWKSEAGKWQEQAAAVRLLTPPESPRRRRLWPFR